MTLTEALNIIGILKKQAAESQAQIHALQMRIVELNAEVQDLRMWRDKAFQAHPNLDLDITALVPVD